MEDNTTPKIEVDGKTYTVKELLGAKITVQVIVDAIAEWAKYHEGNVAFIGSFVALNGKGDVVDECTVGFGDKRVVKTLMENLAEEVEAGKNFISM